MKNPYRQLKQLPLRNAIGWSVSVLLIAKSAIVFSWFTHPESFSTLPGKAYGPLMVAMTGALDLLVIFFLSFGWYDLYRRAWAILPSAIFNLGVTALLLTLAALELTSAPRINRETVLLGVAGAAPLLLALIQLIASMKLYSRIKPSAPPMI